jgi:ribulose-5-phosphate 4-epimerase/fuculose-1-phosphate aldolase
MTENEARGEIVRIGRSLFERGLVHSTAGNISVKLPNGGGYVITPSDACLGFLQADELARVHGNGRQISGLPASKTLALHRRIYAEDADAECVLHTHSTHLVALTLAGVWQADSVMPPITPYQVMKIGRVPLIPYRRPGDPEVADLVAQAMQAARAAGSPIRGVLCERLGPTVWHRSPTAAMAALEEFEETARLWLMAVPKPLTPEQLAELRTQFGAAWP